MRGSVTPNNEDKCYGADSNLPYHTGKSSITGWTKYIPTGNESYGTTDDKTVLDPEDDAAHVVMGGNWRMPTTSELQKLTGKSNVWGAINGVYGRIWYNGTDSSKAAENMLLFIPTGGCRYDNSFCGQVSRGYVWSSSLYSSEPYCAYYMFFNGSGIFGTSTTYLSRCNGYSVRGVIELTEEQYLIWLNHL